MGDDSSRSGGRDGKGGHSPASGGGGRPLRIVQTGDAEHNYRFTLEEENLRSVLDQVPPGMKVSVVSVVGAFRTGKSFLLSLLLRYLRFGGDESWLQAASSSAAVVEGNANLHANNAQGGGGEWDGEDAGSDSSSLHRSFEWRGGEKRMTTGIWMWSEPFVKEIDNGRKVALLLVDTQGMFDNETSMALTACIFGLTTLISSHLVYNVEKRIQEDHLQQLALFSEYGRMALVYNAGEGEEGKGEAASERPEKPFQQLEFLVRDWQNFDDGDDVTKMRRSMDEYLKEVIRDRGVADLQSTREQITSCFEKIACYGLCHPGSRVTKKNFSGRVDEIEEMFVKLVDAFARQLFDDMLVPKKIHGRELTAPELFTYVSTYVQLFRDGAKFPEAKTMLEATSSANNSNAKLVGLRVYKDAMDAICGPKSRSFVKAQVFDEKHESSLRAALSQFDKMATMGSKSAVRTCRGELEAQIAEELTRYREINEGRNPFRDIEYYIIPLSIAMIAFVARWIADASCSSWSTVCARTSDTLGQVYATIFFFILIVSAGKIKQFASHLGSVFGALSLAGGGAMDNSGLKNKSD